MSLVRSSRRRDLCARRLSARSVCRGRRASPRRTTTSGARERPTLSRSPETAIGIPLVSICVPRIVSLKRHFIRVLFRLAVTTDSTTSEEDSVPPPLPAKTRDSTDLSSFSPSFSCTIECPGNENYSIVKANWSSKKVPANQICVENASYEFIRESFSYDDKRKPPTPPPKPNRGSKYVPA